MSWHVDFVLANWKKKEKEYKEVLEAYNEKSKEKALLVNRLIEVKPLWITVISSWYSLASESLKTCSCSASPGIFVAACERKREDADEEARGAQQDSRLTLLDARQLMLCSPPPILHPGPARLPSVIWSPCAMDSWPVQGVACNWCFSLGDPFLFFPPLVSFISTSWFESRCTITVE